MAPPDDTGGQQRDPRTVIVACLGIVGVVVIVLVAFFALPGSVPKNVVNNKGQNMVAIAGAAFSALSAVVSAYFGIKSANVAREESLKAAQRHEIRSAELAGAEPNEVSAANQRATEQIKESGLL